MKWIISLVFLFFSGLIFSQDSKVHTAFNISWPVDTEKPFRLSSTFGESRMDHFHNGLDIPGKGTKIFPVAEGRILWETEAILKPGEIPFGGGKTIVMDHNGYWSGYMHLMEIARNHSPEENIKTSESLGKSGDTGHSGGAHLHFFIYDPVNRKMINPLPFLNLAFYKNTVSPQAVAYGVLIGNEMENVNIEHSFRMSKDYPIYTKIIDSGSGKEKWGLYSFETFSDTEMKSPVEKFVFNYIVFQNNRWQTSNGKVFEDVYYENMLNAGTGYRKNKVLIWKGSGYMGPETIKKIELNIKD